MEVSKIIPDHLKDTLVEVRYSSQIPFELAIGRFFYFLDDTYFYSASSFNQPPKFVNSEQRREINFKFEKVCHFASNEIHLECRPNSFIFNASRSRDGKTNYKGWNAYLPKIEDILTTIQGTKVITDYKWLGLRYISEHPDVSLMHACKLDLKLPQLIGGTLFGHNHKYEIKRSDLNILISLSELNENNNIISLIDIDVNKEIETNPELPDLMNMLDHIHNAEKSIYFDILKEEYKAEHEIIYSNGNIES